MSKRVFPEIIKEVGFDFSWDNEKVWALDIPEEDINLSELAWHFEIPFWDLEPSYYNLAPNQVIQSPNEFKEEYRRTMKADLSHPIDIMENKGRWLILDGLHRLVKAKILGYTRVKVRRIPRSAIPKIKK
ncbi:MAG TPA: ParB/RepB/Spo0J family partition protein [Candidatus Nanoarchaeia archaeon]|nr:ParB/RepB/Spo0J family partition protein [Candidatus Nanoarchaeia archaeon]